MRDENVAWAAPGANSNGIQIEHAGRARPNRPRVSDAYSTAMLDRSAALVAELCRKHGIPAVWLYAADLKAGRRGITTHKAVSDAFKRSSHWDPGTGFPVEGFLSRVRAALGEASPPAGGAPQPIKAPPPPLKQRRDRLGGEAPAAAAAPARGPSPSRRRWTAASARSRSRR